MLKAAHTSNVDFSGQKIAAAFKAAKLDAYDPRFDEPGFLSSFGAGAISELREEEQDLAYTQHGVGVQALDSVLVPVRSKEGGSVLRRRSIAFKLNQSKEKKASLFIPSEAFDPSSVAIHMDRFGYRPASLLELLSFMGQVDGDFIGAVIPYAGKAISSDLGIPWGIMIKKKQGDAFVQRRVLRISDRRLFRSNRGDETHFFLGVQK